MLPTKPTPITIIAGFLGAGKTSLINHLLQKEHSQYQAVLVNDFGAVQLDVSLIAPNGTIQLIQGCICCSSRDELQASVLKMSNAKSLIRHILIETCGVADPVAIVNALEIPELKAQAIVQSVITVVAADQILALKGDLAQLAKRQMSKANWVVLNKIDLVSPRQLNSALRWIQAVDANIPIITTEFGRLPLDAFTLTEIGSLGSH